MRTNLKLAWIAMMGVLTAMSIAGCGGSSGDDSSGSTAATSHEISGTVEIWDFEYESLPGYTEAAKKLDAEFEKLHPDVKVDRVAQPHEGYEELYRAAFVGHEGPDVMQMQPGKSGVLSFKQGLEVINDRLSPDLKEHLTQWESVTPGFIAQGEHYGVPIGLQGFVFYYNKKQFAEAGLPTAFEPTSWAEIDAACEKLKQAGFTPIGGGDEEGLENSLWFGVGFQTENTAEQTTELGEGNIPFTDESVTKGLMPMVEFEEKGFFPKDRFSTTLTDGYAQFAEGKGAIQLGFWNGAGYWGEFDPTLGEKNVGIFFPPTSPLGTISTIAWSIPKFAKNKEAAWAWIEFQASKRGIEILDNTGGFMPNRTDVSLPSSSPIQAQEIVKAARERELVMAPFGVLPSSVAFETLPTELNQVLQGRTSLESAQKAMQETVERTGE